MGQAIEKSFKQRDIGSRRSAGARTFGIVALLAAAIVLVAVSAMGWRAPLRGPNYGPRSGPFRTDLPQAPRREDEPVFRLVLAGDAGERPENESTLARLGRWANEDVERTQVVYLGDNVYPSGLQRGDRERGEAILRGQIEASRAPVLFLPGNHDWGHRGRQWLVPGVLAAQERFVEANGAAFLPDGGCPGPAMIELVAPGEDLAGGLTLVAIDVHWWLLPEDLRPVCEGIEDTPDFISRLEEILDAHRGGNLVVAAHHPIRSGGPHGGQTRGFWADLAVSFIFPFYRVQDTISPGYEQMVALLSEAMSAAPPLAMVAGHDHNLQVIDGGDAARLLIVSGAASKTTRATTIEGTLFAHAAKGFVVLDFHREADGETLLVHVIETAEGDEPVFSTAVELDDRRDEPSPSAPPTAPRSPRR